MIEAQRIAFLTGAVSIIAASQAGALLDSIRATGAVSAVGALQEGDAELIARHADAFVRAVLWGPEEDFVALSFSPSAAFDQTPGPRAATAHPARRGAGIRGSGRLHAAWLFSHRWMRRVTRWGKLRQHAAGAFLKRA